MRRILVLAGFVIAAAAIVAAEEKSTPIEVARNEAESNAKSPAGRSYEGVVIGRVDEWLRPIVERCLKDAPAEDRIAFNVFVKVGAVGKPEEVLHSPDTAPARCVEPGFRDMKYPSPPMPDWWVKIEVRLKQ